MISLLVLFGLSMQPLNYNIVPKLPPLTENLSLTRQIMCNEGFGSGFIVRDGVIATALHVASMTGCVDRETGNKLTTYHVDKAHDFALMSGTTPLVKPMEIDCRGYRPGQEYFAYGISSFHQRANIFRRVGVEATSEFEDVKIEDMTADHARVLDGYIVPGMSGGNISDPKTLKAVGIVNAGWFDDDGNPTGRSYSIELKYTILCTG